MSPGILGEAHGEFELGLSRAEKRLYSNLTWLINKVSMG